MIEDLLFKRFKTLEIREDVREEYDNLKARKTALELQIKSEKETPTMEQGEIARLDDKLVLLNRDIERSEAQLKGMDLDVYGSKPTNEYPDGVQGINQQLDALRELEKMIKDYIKTL